VKNPNPQIPCQIFHRAKGAPRFVVSHGNDGSGGKPPATEQEMMDRVVQVQNSLGSTDVTILRSEYVQISGQSAFEAVVSYKADGVALTNHVLMFQRPNDSISVAATDLTANYPRSEADISAISHSLRFPGYVPEGVGMASRWRSLLPAILLLALAAIGAGVMFSRFRAQRR